MGLIFIALFRLILKNTDFLVFTIEHNFIKFQLKIDYLMCFDEYIRVFKSLTAFDAWYVAKEIFNEMNI